MPAEELEGECMGNTFLLRGVTALNIYLSGMEDPLIHSNPCSLQQF